MPPHEPLSGVDAAWLRMDEPTNLMTITGVLVAVIAVSLSFGEFGLLLGAVVGVSMVANLVIAGFFGAVTPLVLDRLGYDPATSATIFITTATDVLGFLVFLGLARAVLV